MKYRDYTAKYLTVFCPTCGEPPEEPCCSLVTGCVLDGVHFQRANAAQEAERKMEVGDQKDPRQGRG